MVPAPCQTMNSTSFSRQKLMSVVSWMKIFSRQLCCDSGSKCTNNFFFFASCMANVVSHNKHQTTNKGWCCDQKCEMCPTQTPTWWEEKRNGRLLCLCQVAIALRTDADRLLRWRQLERLARAAIAEDVSGERMWKVTGKPLLIDAAHHDRRLNSTSYLILCTERKILNWLWKQSVTLTGNHKSSQKPSETNTQISPPPPPRPRNEQKFALQALADQCAYKRPFEALSVIFVKPHSFLNEFRSFHWASANLRWPLISENVGVQCNSLWQL